MQLQRLRHLSIAVLLLLAVTALAGCGNSQQASFNPGTGGTGQQGSPGTNGIPSNATPAQVQKAMKQQRAQMAAYIKQHPEAGGRAMGSAYSAQMGVIRPGATPGEAEQAVRIQVQQQAAYYKAHSQGH